MCRLASATGNCDLVKGLCSTQRLWTAMVCSIRNALATKRTTMADHCRDDADMQQAKLEALLVELGEKVQSGEDRCTPTHLSTPHLTC